MKVIGSIQDFPEKEKPVSLTIGNFDGVHLGHLSVLDRLKEAAEKHQALSVVLTFSNHPSTVLSPESPIPLLTTTDHRLELLKDLGIDEVILLEFTEKFSNQTAREFLQKIMSAMNLKFLVLGHDSRIGKDRKGGEEVVKEFAETHGFTVEYVGEKLIGGKPVSSSRVRQLVQKGNFSEAEKLLGRRYSIKLQVQPGKGLGKQIGYSTANLDVKGLCIPPIGVYSVWLKTGDGVFESVANLGYAPTVRGGVHPQLEVHVIGKKIDITGKPVEVIFHRFIRDERKFAAIEVLTAQIAQDIEKAKSQLSGEAASS